MTTAPSRLILPGGSRRPRRLRRSRAMRRLFRETRLDPARLIAPVFVVDGTELEVPIASLPGHARMSPDICVDWARQVAELGIGGILFFGIPARKDEEGAAAADPLGPVPTAVRGIKDKGLDVVLIADVCLCEYTTHGHCGVLSGTEIDNDNTLPRLGHAAVTYADAGADLVAPSAMMDHQVGALRAALDESGFEQVGVMSYASKHASAFYQPFREAAGSSPSFGDRKSYQLDTANGREAMREMQLDADEGADVLMVKPALTSLDLLVKARSRFDLPLAAYQVSGEAAMIEAAAARGWVDRRAAIVETLEAITRAGADLVISYFAVEVARWLRE